MPRDDSDAADAEKRRKVRTSHAPYNITKKVGRPPKGDASRPKTSAIPAAKSTREQLTTSDWLLVYAFRDANPGFTQMKIVDHFKKRPEGALIFSQATLARKLKEREAVEARAVATPNGMSLKRDRVVTSPLVEKALVKLIRQFEERGDHYTGDMLSVARGNFEKQLNIPEEQRL
ncbi:hypothetical protein BD626DRAFT_436653, partial [Schizophyllum amplum]